MPDDIFAVQDIPKTLNAKKLEVPVKKILMGKPVKEAVNIDSMSNPAAMGLLCGVRPKISGAIGLADRTRPRRLSL